MTWLYVAMIFLMGAIAGGGIGHAMGQSSVWRFISERERETFVMKDFDRDH